MQRIPEWLYVSIWTATLVFFVAAALPSLQGGEMNPQSILTRFIGPAILLLVSVFLSLFEQMLPALQGADLKTWLFLTSVMVAGVFFFAAFLITDEKLQERLIQAASAIVGFGAGLEVGGRLEPSRGSSRANRATQSSGKGRGADKL